LKEGGRKNAEPRFAITDRGLRPGIRSLELTGCTFKHGASVTKSLLVPKTRRWRLPGAQLLVGQLLIKVVNCAIVICTFLKAGIDVKPRGSRQSLPWQHFVDWSGEPLINTPGPGAGVGTDILGTGSETRMAGPEFGVASSCTRLVRAPGARWAGVS
jgi:hypothetical protein